jgi:Tol biopolymer transport system component
LRRPDHAAAVRLRIAVASVVALALCVGAWEIFAGRMFPASAGQPSGGSSPAAGARPAAPLDATGRLLIPIEGGLSVVGLPDRDVTDVVRVQANGAVIAARWAPGGASAAYAASVLEAAGSAGRAELSLTDFAGGPRLLIRDERPGASLDAPAWTPDGRSVYVSSAALVDQRLDRWIERIDIDSGARTAVMEGFFPDLSPDGASLVRVRSDRRGDVLALTAPDGRDPRALILPGRFSRIGPARFSPDGQTLAVPLSAPDLRAREPVPARPWGLLGSSIAFAHGDPWDVFLMDVAGGEPRRLTRLAMDEPTISWAPDGTQLAVWSSLGLHLADRAGRVTFALDRGGYGGIDWSR